MDYVYLAILFILSGFFMKLSDELLTVNETCKLLKISRPTLLKLMRKGSIKGFKIGKRVWRIRRSEVEEYIEKYDESVNEH